MREIDDVMCLSHLSYLMCLSHLSYLMCLSQEDVCKVEFAANVPFKVNPVGNSN